MAEVKRITSHFIRDGEVWECDYSEVKPIDRFEGTKIVHFKVYGSERRCACPDQMEIWEKLKGG